MTEQITICGARLHNLKHISLLIPKNKLVVLTGPSGSGKSTLGFDILYKEGQRQYMEALGILPYELSRAPVELISGLSPTVSLEARVTNRSPRSTVGTATEVYTYLRVLYAHLGERPCPHCGESVPALGRETSAEAVFGLNLEDALDNPESYFACPRCSGEVLVLEMAHFSFNKPSGACPTCTGLGVLKQVDLGSAVDEQKSLLNGAVAGWEAQYAEYYTQVFQAAAKHYGLQLDLSLPIENFNPALRDLLYYGVADPKFQHHFPLVEPPKNARKGRFEGVSANLRRRFAERIQETEHNSKMDRFLVTKTCPDCLGTRLNLESRRVTVRGQAISDISRLPLTELGSWLESLSLSFNADEKAVAEPILFDLRARIKRLVDVGAGYLALERSSPSLSQGEAQRLRLAALLGSSLSGLLYIFDEPTIGIHPRDNQKLIRILHSLRDLGNTVLVIEHDLDVVAAADHVIDFGPGGGKHGGRVVAAGTPAQIARQAGSPTGDYLSGRASIPIPEKRRTPGDKNILIRAARHHNLKELTVRLPLGLLVAVTGVSGSGKSSLIFDILERSLRQRLYGSLERPGEHAGIDGLENLNKVIAIDQESVVRMPRSNLATYADIFTPIRDAFAHTAEAKQLLFSARRFSFNVPGGRCERCEGAGFLTVPMHFMTDVEVRCPVCRGRRFTAETLQVKYRGCSIADVLEMTVEEALELFQAVPSARRRLEVLSEVGLGYLQLGQPAATLSGGEAQRVKLAKELGRGAAKRSLYLLDEPTTGLHLVDTARLLGLLQRLVDKGSSVIVIEHNLEVIKTADWVIDLGPEGGEAGGYLIAQGTPEQVAQEPASFTGHFLKEILAKKRLL